MPHAARRVTAVLFAFTLLSRGASASKISDGVTAGINESNVSNIFNLSLDVVDPFTLEASWQLLDTDTGRFNNFALGGDIKIGRSFDLDLLLDFAPRANGVRTFGLTLTPTVEIDEGDDFYTALSLPLLSDRYNIIQSEHRSACLLGRRPLLCAGIANATAQVDITQVGVGLTVEQGIYDGALLAEIGANRYSDKAALRAFGREFSLANVPIRFSQIGGLLPTFPVLYEAKLLASYRFRFGEGSFVTIKPVASFTHLVYEADHGHGEIITAKLVGTIAKTIEITGGYQVLLDDEADPSGASSASNQIVIHYAVISVGWLFGAKDDVALPPLSEEESKPPPS
jgi:hypothetical protein